MFLTLTDNKGLLPLEINAPYITIILFSIVVVKDL